MGRRLLLVLIAVSIVVGTGCGSPSTGGGSSTSSVAPEPMTVAYGPAPSQFGVLSLPVTAGAPLPVVVLIHGGFWRAEYGLDLMEPLASDLMGRGFAVWNIEYRRVGEDGGGWPGTLDDVAAAIDDLAVLARDHPLDLARVAVVGHSAGGHLALWSATRGALTPGEPGAGPQVTPVLAVGQGPVFDMVKAGDQRLGNGAAVDLLGGTPAEVPERYAVATPSVGTPARLVVVQGSADDVVPAEFTVPTPSTGVEVIEVADADHFDLIDPGGDAWRQVVDVVDGALR